MIAQVIIWALVLALFGTDGGSAIRYMLLHLFPKWPQRSDSLLMKTMMLAAIDPATLPALRIAATFFFIVYLAGGAYIFRNRHRFFDRDPSVDNDIPAVRKVRIEVVATPWFFLTTLILILLIGFWLA
jgi:hypothetical protein